LASRHDVRAVTPWPCQPLHRLQTSDLRRAIRALAAAEAEYLGLCIDRPAGRRRPPGLLL